MTNNKVLYIVIVIVVLVIIGGFFFFSGNKSAQNGTEIGQQAVNQPSTERQVSDTTMIDCGQAQDPGCFMNRINGCLPVTTKMIASDGKTSINIAILGVENEKCHFQRKINNIMDLDCQFPKGTFNVNTLDQIFGNDRGLQKVVDDACVKPGF